MSELCNIKIPLINKDLKCNIDKMTFAKEYSTHLVLMVHVTLARVSLDNIPVGSAFAQPTRLIVTIDGGTAELDMTSEVYLPFVGE